MMRTMRIVAAVAAGTLALVSAAADRTWRGGDAGDWSLDANWLGGVPGENDHAVFDSEGAVTVEISGTNRIGKLTVNRGTVTLKGAGDAPCLHFTGIDGAAATGFAAKLGATVVMEVPVCSEIRCEKSGPGTGIFRSSVVLNPKNSNYVSWYGQGSNVFEKGSSLIAPYCYFGVGQQQAGETACIILRDDAHIAIAGEADFSGSGDFDRFALILDGDDARLDVGNTFYLNRYSTVAQDDTDIRLVVNRGTLTVGGSLCTATDSGKAQGKFIQTGGMANLYRIICYAGGAVKLRGGVTTLSGSNSSYGEGTELELAGGTYAPSFDFSKLPSYMHVTADSTVRVPSGSTWLFGQGDAAIDPGVTLTKTGGGALSIAPDSGFSTSLTVAEGSAATSGNASFAWSGDWKLAVVSNATFTVASGAAFASLFDLEVAGTATFAASEPVTVKSFSVDGAAQAPGSYLDGKVICTGDWSVWTGAGDGRSWSDGENWSGGSVPASAADANVDLSAAAGEIAVGSAVKVGAIRFAPVRARTLKLAGAGSVDFATATRSATALTVALGSKLEFGVDVLKSGTDNVLIAGGGTVEFKKAIPDSTLAAAAFSVHGTVILSGTNVLDVLAFSMREHKASRIEIVDGADITAGAVLFSPSIDDCEYMVDDVVQSGGIVRAGEFSICNLSSSDNDRTRYLQTGGELVVTGTMLVGILPAAADAALVAKRRFGGEYEITGGRLTVAGVKTFENSNYVKFHGGEVCLQGGISSDKTGKDACAGYVNDAYPLLFGGSTICLDASETSVNIACQIMFSGIGGETVVRRADAHSGYKNFNIKSTTAGNGGFVFAADDCVLDWEGWVAYSGRLTVSNNYYIYLGGIHAAACEYVVKKGSVCVRGTMNTSPRSITVQTTGTGTGGTLWTENQAAGWMTVRHYVIGGVEQAGGDYCLNSGDATTRVLHVETAPDSWIADGTADLSYADDGETKTLGERTELSSLVFAPAKTAVGGVTVGGTAALVFKDGATIEVSEGKTVTFDVPVELGGKVVKKGLGKVVFNQSVTSTCQDAVDPYGTTDVYWLTVKEGAADFDGAVTRVRLITAGADKSEVPVITLKQNCTVSYYASVFTAYASDGSTKAFGETRQKGATVDFRSTSYYGYDGRDWSTPLSRPNGGRGRYVLDSGKYYFYGSTSTAVTYGGSRGDYEFVQNGGEVTFENWTIVCQGDTAAYRRFSWTLNGGTLSLQYPWSNGGLPDFAQVRLNGGTLAVGLKSHPTGRLYEYDPFPSGQFAVSLGGTVAVEAASGITAAFANRTGGAGSVACTGAGTVKFCAPPPADAFSVADGATLAFTESGADDLSPDSRLDLAAGATICPMFGGLCTFGYATVGGRNVWPGVYYESDRRLGRLVDGTYSGGVRVLGRLPGDGMLFLIR